MDEPEKHEMTERDRYLAEMFAQHAAARVLDALKNPKVADDVIDTWSERIQKSVGRWAIRAILYLFSLAVLLAMIKAGAIESMAAWLSSSRGK